MVERAIEAGATTINIPDTVGYTTPAQFAARHPAPHARTCAASTRRDARVHCHDDLGLAVANTLAGAAGRRAPGRVHDQRHRRARRQLLARGGRDGAAHAPRLLRRSRPAIHTEQLYPTSRLVASVTGMHVQRNKAIVGQNAFAHEAGIHQDGMLKHRATYEIMRPEDVGFTQHRPRARQALGPPRARRRA